MVLTTPQKVRMNANHLKNISTEVLQACIDEMHILYIADYMSAFPLEKLAIIEKYLAQHLATLNRRRADSENIGGMSKNISVPKGEDLRQTEYGQMAKKTAKSIGLPWGNDTELATVKIY